MTKLASLKEGERLEMAWLLSYYVSCHVVIQQKGPHHTPHLGIGLPSLHMVRSKLLFFIHHQAPGIIL